MKNENVPEIEQAQHEKLCAYVFGELQGAERAAFEVELLRSPVLQRERERLTATIGLVQRAVPDEGLSTAVRRDLLASARRSRFRFLRGRSLVRVAAAVVLILGGVFAVRMLTGRVNSFTERSLQNLKVARSPVTPGSSLASGAASEADRASEGAAADALEELRNLGYVGSGGPPADGAAAPAPEVAQALEALGYSGGGGAESLAFRLAPQGAAGAQLTAITDAKQISLGVPAEEERRYGTGTPPAFAARRAGASLGTGGGDQGGRAVAATRSATAKTLTAPVVGGVYRGPSDSKPAREALEDKIGNFLASAPAAPAAGEARDGATIGLAAAHQLPAAELLDLGYVGEDDSDESRKKQEDSFRSRREPVLTREQVAAQVEQLLGASRVAPGETPSDMFFRYWGDSPFQLAEEQKTSTFAVDVDTASYALVRAYLNRGELPPREAVRTEEFVNYFKADQAPPTDGQPFAIGLELAPSLFAKDARTEMLRVTVRGKDVAESERQPVALTFVIDTSGSMEEGGRLELVKRALTLLLRQLGSGDSVAVVKFSNQAAVVTPMIPAARRGELEGLIQALSIEGGTNVEAGLRLGYEVALQGLAHGAVNRVILCSDGVGNIGETGARGLLEFVKEARLKGIYFNTVGVGMGNHNDAFLEELADKGDGVCNYVDSDAEAKRVFVDGLASALQPIARDVKIQVEFDPLQVESWRLLGYENRVLREQDFKNDKIDAGEVNAGHQVTALYELVRRPSRSGALATVHLRYKPPFAIDQGKEGERARTEAELGLEQDRPLQAATVLPGFAAATNGYQRAVLVAQFAEVLRQSVHARGDAFANLLRESRRLEKALGDPDFSEFVALLERANPLLDARTKEETPLVQQLLDELSGLHHEQALRERKRDLALQAGEPEKPKEEKQADEQVEREAREKIQRLEAEVRAELYRVSGIEQPTPDERRELQELGYGGDDE